MTPNSPGGAANHFGGSLGGPVRSPSVYNGPDDLFFFFSHHGFYERRPETFDAISRTFHVSPGVRATFSNLAALDPVKYTIYDPAFRMGVPSTMTIDRRQPVPQLRAAPRKALLAGPSFQPNNLNRPHHLRAPLR